MKEYNLFQYPDYLAYRLKNPDKYEGYIRAILKREGIDIEELAKNIVLYRFKYSCDVEWLSASTRKAYLSALNTLFDFTHPKENKLRFHASENIDSNSESLINFKNDLDNFISSNELSKDNYCELYSIEKGSTILTFILSGLIFSVSTVKAIKLIKLFSKSRKEGEKKIRKASKGVLKTIEFILYIAEFLHVLGNVILGTDIQLSSILIQGLLELIGELL